MAGICPSTDNIPIQRGDLLIGNTDTPSVLTRLGVGGAGTTLLSNGSDPLWGNPSLSIGMPIIGGIPGDILVVDGSGLLGQQPIGLSGAGVANRLAFWTGTSTLDDVPRTLTPGSVLFVGSDFLPQEDNSGLFYNDTDNELIVGATAHPLASLKDRGIVVVRSGGTPAVAEVDLYQFGASGLTAGFRATATRGTVGTPGQGLTDDGSFLAFGTYDSSGNTYSNSLVTGQNAESQTSTARGSYLTFHTTALLSTTRTERFRIGPSGQWGIAGATYGSAGNYLRSGGASAAPTWQQIAASEISGLAHALLDGSVDSDTAAGTVARGDVITGQGASAKWTRLAKGTANQVLAMDGTATDVLWATVTSGVTDHTLLTNLAWTSSGHTGTASRLAAFGGAGAAALIDYSTDFLSQYALLAGRAGTNAFTGKISLTGALGIGAASPTSQLDVFGPSQTTSMIDVHSPNASPYAMRFFNDTISSVNPRLAFYVAGSGDAQYGTLTSNSLIFFTNGLANQRLQITSGGAVEIFAPTSGDPLTITGQFLLKNASNSNFLNFYSTTAGASKWIQYLNGDDFYFYDSGIRLTLQGGGRGNLAIDTTSFPATGTAGLIFADGTALSSMASNTAGLYADDIAGNVSMHAINENGDVIKLYRQSNIAAPSGGLVVDAESRTAISSLLGLLQNNGLMT